MSKKNKNRSYEDWDYEWMQDLRDEDVKRAQEEERRSRRELKSQYTHYDWNDEN